MMRSTVILRDVDDSIRFATKLKELNAIERRRSHTPRKEVMGLSAENSNLLFVSSGYWPINDETTHFEYPDEFKAIFEDIQAKFKSQRALMYLQQHNNLGSVDVELSFNNGEKHVFKCEPIQALLVMLFDKDNNKMSRGISLEKMAESLKSHPNYIKSKIFYWLKKGVIREVKKNANQSGSLAASHLNFSRGFSRMDTFQEETAVYELVEDYVPIDSAEPEDDEIDNEQISREKLTTRDMLYSLKRYEDKIISLLTTNGSKTMPKIKVLLDTVYKVDNALINMNELSEILTAMVKRRKLIVFNDVYSVCTHN